MSQEAMKLQVPFARTEQYMVFIICIQTNDLYYPSHPLTIQKCKTRLILSGI